MLPKIDRAALGPLTRIADGGFGIVYRAAQHRVAGCGMLAFKEFKQAPDPLTLDNLAEVMDFRERLDPDRRSTLDKAASWPLRMVVDRGRVVGYVMPLVPDDFFFEQTLPSGRVSQEDREAQWLVVDPVRAGDANIAVPAADDLPDRLVLCLKLAHVMGLLHRSGIVYGDLSLKNVLFAENPWRIMLVDCDGVTARDDVEQANSPDWEPPEIIDKSQPRQDQLTDRYKLALFIVRCLRPGPRASLTVDPDRVAGLLDEEGVRMMHAGLGRDRARRPSAKEWFDHLLRQLSVVTNPPEVTQFSVVPDVVRVGGGVTVTWDAPGATRIVIADVGGRRAELPTPRGELLLTVRSTGAFTLTAENGYGRTSRTSESVFALRPPDIRSVRIPEPAMPDPGSLGTAGLADVLVDLTAARTTAPVLALPDTNANIAFPDFPDLTRLLPPARGPAAGSDSFAGLLTTLQGDARAVARGVARAARPRAGSRSPSRTRQEQRT